MSKRDLKIRSFKHFNTSNTKEELKEEFFLEATYDKEKAKKKLE